MASEASLKTGLGFEGQGQVLVAPGLEGTVISAGCVEVEEEVFEDLGGVAQGLEDLDQGEALPQDAFHDVSPDPVGFRNSFSRVWVASVTTSSVLHREANRPGPWRPWPP